jgi:hypothetical protein
MWFASLGNYQRNPWFVVLVGRLLEGSKDVAGLLQYNPFPVERPKMIRSSFYSYHFTDLESGKNGSWWQRTLKGEYMNTMDLDNVVIKTYLKTYSVGGRPKVP